MASNSPNKPSNPLLTTNLLELDLPVMSHPGRARFWLTELRGKALSQVRWKGSKLGEPCPKVRLSQDRLPIEPFACMKS